MPYIKTVVNTMMSEHKRELMKDRLGRDVAILGKSESWLMVDFHEDAHLFFKGTDDPAAIVSVDLYGSAGGDAYNKMTAAVTKMLYEELDIPADRVFVKYSEYKNWGYNGSNF